MLVNGERSRSWSIHSGGWSGVHGPNFNPAEAMLEAMENATTSPVCKGGTQYLNFEALGQSESLSERTPVNHPYASSCMVTAPATERYATASPYCLVLHIDWPPGGGRVLARRRGCWLGSIWRGSSRDSDAGKSSYRLVLSIENEIWICCHKAKDWPWRQIKAD